jgi:hypothetical protein
MSLPARIVLHSPVADQTALGPFVEQCLADGVCLVAIFGEGAEALEEEIDWLVIGDGADKSRFLVTSAHPGESVERVIEFASLWTFERDGLSEVRL